MAIKLKQYLENSWYRWASQDRQTWYAAQFQYWVWINVRDMRNWVCLAWGRTDITSFSKPFTYFTYNSNLYLLDTDWKIYDNTWTLKCSSWVSWANVWVEFSWYIYVVWSGWVAQIDNTFTVSDVTPTWWANHWTCALNYANTFLLVWDWNLVWRFDLSWLPAEQIRNFDASYDVFWLTQEWNYLKIYVSNWVDSKVHYAKGTFDVEDTWLVQTVSFKGLALNKWTIASDQGNDYAIFSPTSWEYKLAKVQWYNKTDIRWTQKWWWERIFTASAANIIASDWVLFAAMDEWIWTFTEYNWWLWWWCVEFATQWQIISMFRYWEQLYVCCKVWDDYIESYYDMSFHPAKYQTSWYIIGRVFDWWCAWLFKKNDQATITYNMPEWTSMELSYRYDRSSFWYDKSNFVKIKSLLDTNNCYDIVVPTTPSLKEESLLLMENWTDKILLENWNWIQLEDLLICPFNMTWNLLEYRVDLYTNDNTKTPILFEHSLTYYDYMRKYR